jgi:hypothetical protein
VLAGWTVAVWVLQRYRRHGPARQVGIFVAVWPFICCAGLILALTALVTLVTGSEGFSPKDVQLPQVVLQFLPTLVLPATVVVGGAALVGVGLAALPGGGVAARTPRRRVGRAG